MGFFYNYIKRYKISKYSFIAFFIFIFLSVYFFTNAFIGKDGYKEYIDVKSQIREKKYIQDSLLNKKKSKEEKIIKMRPQSLDIDLLDEEVKKNLGYVNDKEIMIYQEKDN
jgi:cell division protein FtsB|tara:strand:- start:8241 stop:8573 length:333 start_codon:yes stop_codon:yes gene_type:complete